MIFIERSDRITDMRKEWAVAIIITVVVGAILVGADYFGQTPAFQGGKSSNQLPLTKKSFSSGELATIAEKLAAKVAEISPTPSLGEVGWIAQRISFAGDRFVYIEYTDTHVSLRLLAEYFYDDPDLKTKVLATFLPNERGGWDLQFGNDLAKGLPLYNFIFDGDSNQWIPEITSDNY